MKPLALCLSLVACAPIDPIGKRMQREHDGGTTAAWLLIDTQSGEVLSSRNPTQRMLPASVMKLVSTFVALRVLGAEHRFITELAFDRPFARSLRANLVVSPSGDPSFSSPRFDDTRETVARIADAIVAAGVDEWSGDVVLTEENTPLYAAGATQDDLGSEYAPPATRFYFAENTRVRTLDRKTQATDDVTFRLHSAGAFDSACRRAPQATTTLCEVALPDELQRFTVRWADTDPLQSFARALQLELSARGVAWRRETLAQKPTRTPLLQIASPALSTLARLTNKLSLNVYADALAFAVARAQGKDRRFEAAAAALRDELASAGLDLSGAFVFDGSGLSRYDALSPAFVVALLQAGLSSSFSDVWLSGFAVAAADGTLKRRAGPSLVFAKTGTMRAQRGLAGIAYRPSDPRHPLVSFAIFIDHHPGSTSASNALLDDLIPLLAGAEAASSAPLKLSSVCAFR